MFLEYKEGIMELIKYRDGKRILIKPKNASSLPLFKHCANGSIAVTTRVYNKEIVPLLMAHGTIYIHELDET